MFENMKVKDINEFVNNIDENDYMKYIDLLSKDTRTSVQKIAIKLSKKLDALRKEEERIHKIQEFERSFYEKGYTYIGGIDEAGRGPLAGPVVAAVVVFDKNVDIKYIDDSKKLSQQKRNELFDIIKNEALDYGVGIVDNDKIDDINILNATYLAMKKAINNLKNKPDCLLIDAVTIPNIDIHQKGIIKGDSKSISIAAASILAKVTRDKLMYEYDDKYSEYGFSKHKGYGTKQHYEALEAHGITPIHRRSFLKSILNGD